MLLPSPQALEAQLQEMEFKLTHESLTAAQEKALRERKERTEKDKPAVARLAAVSAAIDAARAASDDLRAQIKAVNEQLDKIKSSREAEEAKLAALRASEAEARSDVPALHVEKKEQWEVIQALREKQREVRSAFNDKWEEFKKRDRAFKAWFAQERKKRCAERNPYSFTHTQQAPALTLAWVSSCCTPALVPCPVSLLCL